MITREIPRENWAEFFDEMSDIEELDVVTVEAVGPDVGAQLVARDLRLMGITLNEKGSDKGAIMIILGDSPDFNVEHTIMTPSHVRIEETEDGAPQALQIEADSEPTTLLHFKPFAQTDIMDGTVGLEDETESSYVS